MQKHSSTSESPWLTLAEASARARVNRRTLGREVAAGRLRAARVGGRRTLRFRAEWVDSWLTATVTPVEPMRSIEGR